MTLNITAISALLIFSSKYFLSILQNKAAVRTCVGDFMSYSRRLVALGSGRIFDLQKFTISCLPATVSVVVGSGGGAVNGDVVPSGRTRCMTGGTVAARIIVNYSGDTRPTRFDISFAAFVW